MTPVTPGQPDNSGIPCADGSASREAEYAESRLPRRIGGTVKGLLVLASLGLLSGCGGGLDFTGGSIPPGGTRLFGRVAAAENPLVPLANVSVVVESRPITGGLRTLHTTTASDGSFDFISVASGSTSTVMTVMVTPDPKQGRQPQKIVFGAQMGVAGDLVVTLPLSTFKVTSAAKLTLQDIAALPPHKSASVHARLYDAAGNRLLIAPSLLLTGNIGSIAVDETFAAETAGSGSITAFWYDLAAPTKPVTVALGAVEPPPDPPELPPVLLPDPIQITTPPSR